MKNFIKLAEGIDPTALLEAIPAPMWEEFTLRQLYEGSAHADTQTIVLRGPTSTEGVFDNLDAVDWGTILRLGAPLLDLTAELCRIIGAREVGRVMLVKLKPEGQVTPHRDEGAYARYFSRFHFVLSSPEHCRFVAGDELEHVHMAPGELWWFNHQVPHAVANGQGERIHLIIDATAPGFNGAISPREVQ